MNDLKLMPPPAEVGQQGAEAHREPTGAPPGRCFHNVIRVRVAKMLIGADGWKVTGVDGEYDVVTAAQ
jgi:hypothetical protein